MSYDFNQDMRQWADIEGGFHPDRQWLLSSADTWHENPHYKGEPQPHPEDEVGENNQEPDETPVITDSEGALIALRDNIKHMLDAANADWNWQVDELFKRIGIDSP
jgi:hypothetical protein